MTETKYEDTKFPNYANVNNFPNHRITQNTEIKAYQFCEFNGVKISTVCLTPPFDRGATVYVRFLRFFKVTGGIKSIRLQTLFLLFSLLTHSGSFI